ncbi:MAG: glycosyltransferase family 2 protein [Leptolyngbya sp. SIO1D8]|nr:glycosyltransferase family 2 protein [Leptolyngbya sp. SIO1D8]
MQIVQNRRLIFSPLRSQRIPAIARKIFLMLVILVGLPSLFCIALNVNTLWLHYGVSAAYLLTCGCIIAESLTATRSLQEPSVPTTVPRVTFIVVAYLPNEQDLILQTLGHILNRVRKPDAPWELILAYNSPTRLPINEQLNQLAASHPNFRQLWVKGSHSKAENLNAAVRTARGDMICLLDADHWPDVDCVAQAWRWLSNGYDVVQGRCVVRNHSSGIISRLVSIEFEAIYGLFHHARSVIAQTAIFGGSNAYWRADALRRMHFNRDRLTEDIDVSVRAVARGIRFIHDRTIVSTEMAPASFKALFTQRKRWAQGWLEVTLLHQLRLWRSRHLTLWQKLYWTYTLSYREVFTILSLQVYTALLTQLLLDIQITPTSRLFLWVTSAVCLATGIIHTLFIQRYQAQRYPLANYVLYVGLHWLFVTWKGLVSLIAWYDHVTRKRDWVVTPRQ